MSGRSWLLARAWLPVFAIAAILLAPSGTTLRSTYALRWLAAALVLIAAIGRRDRRIAIATALISAAGALYIAADNVSRINGGASAARWFYIAGAVMVIALSLRQLAPPSRFDPVMLVAIQLAIGLAAYWLYYQFSGLALDYRNYPPESVLRTAGIELALIALAFAGVGLGVQRTWRPAAQRLGWSKPQGWQGALALLVATVFLLSNLPLNLLAYWLEPSSLLAIGRIYQRVFTGVPWWSYPLIALMAGVGEETMFRGALQPRFGILATALLFALIHIQYGPTLILAWIFVHGLAYGLIRRHINTTTAVLAHATYDFGAFLSVFGFITFALIALLMALYLWEPATRNRRLIWNTVQQGFVDDWKGLRQRSYLSPLWKSPPSSTA